jgi:hypothetical protein
LVGWLVGWLIGWLVKLVDQLVSYSVSLNEIKFKTDKWQPLLPVFPDELDPKNQDRMKESVQW